MRGLCALSPQKRTRKGRHTAAPDARRAAKRKLLFSPRCHLRRAAVPRGRRQHHKSHRRRRLPAPRNHGGRRQPEARERPGKSRGAQDIVGNGISGPRGAARGTTPRRRRRPSRRPSAREAADPLMTVHGDADANPYARPARGGGGCAVSVTSPSPPSSPSCVVRHTVLGRGASTRAA